MADSMDKKLSNVPNLRFPCFNGAWEQKTIKSITVISAGATPKTTVSSYWGGNIKWMNSGELNDKHIFDVAGRITESGFKNTSTKLLPKNCVLIGLAGQGKTRGTAAINHVELCTNQSIAAIWPCEILNPLFLYFNIDSRYNELRELSSGDGGRGGLNLSLIGSLKVPLCTLAEQKKIASFLSLIEERINTQNKIIKEKNNIFISLSQNFIFNKKANRSLKDICVINKGQQVNNEFLLENGQYSFINGGITASGYYDKFNRQANTITISEGGNSCGFVNFNSEPIWVGGHCYSLDSLSTSVNKDYLFYYLKYKEKEIMKLRVGTGLPNIQKNDLLSFNIYLPSIEEQNKIACIFNVIFKSIHFNELLLEKYKIQKRFLLENLFK